jgi:hypothetical protein
MEPILTATPIGPWTQMLTPTASHVATTNATRSHQLQVVSKTREDKSGAIASYRTGLVLEAQRISKLKRRNGAEGTQRSTAATRTSHQMASAKREEEGIRPALTKNYFLKVWPSRSRATTALFVELDGHTKARPKISKNTPSIRCKIEGGGSALYIRQPSNPIRDFLTPHIGIRALGGDNQCLPVCRCGTGKASAVSASLKLSIRSGEIFAVSKHRAEV